MEEHFNLVIRLVCVRSTSRHFTNTLQTNQTSVSKRQSPRKNYKNHTLTQITVKQFPKGVCASDDMLFSKFCQHNRDWKHVDTCKHRLWSKATAKATLLRWKILFPILQFGVPCLKAFNQWTTLLSGEDLLALCSRTNRVTEWQIDATIKSRFLEKWIFITYVNKGEHFQRHHLASPSHPQQVGR